VAFGFFLQGFAPCMNVSRALLQHREAFPNSDCSLPFGNRYLKDTTEQMWEGACHR